MPPARLIAVLAEQVTETKVVGFQVSGTNVSVWGQGVPPMPTKNTSAPEGQLRGGLGGAAGERVEGLLGDDA